MHVCTGDCRDSAVILPTPARQLPEDWGAHQRILPRPAPHQHRCLVPLAVGLARLCVRNERINDKASTTPDSLIHSVSIKRA